MDQNPYKPPGSKSTVVEVERRSWGTLLRATAAVPAALIALAALWTLPIGGFHHMYLIGIFGWLLINGEDPDSSSLFYLDGVEIVPTCGLIPTVAITGILGWVVWKFVRWKGKSLHVSDQ